MRVNEIGCSAPYVATGWLAGLAGLAGSIRLMAH